MLDNFLFIYFPYAAAAVAVVGTVWRLKKGFQLTSLSSQFLESDELFYGSVAWHFGILGALAGHVVGFLLPLQVLWFDGVPVRLYLLETTGLLCGLLALVGVVSLAWRRLRSARIRAVTSPMDAFVLLLLLAQVALGVYTALFLRWGSAWYATSAVPYLRSLFVLQPDLAPLAPLPLAVKLHVAGAYLLMLVFPFSRLVHMVAVPLQYLWRPYQQVMWNWDRRRRLPQSPAPAPRPGARAPAAGERAPVVKPAATR
jgi:nitrate reductase gamma subunit